MEGVLGVNLMRFLKAILIVLALGLALISINNFIYAPLMDSWQLREFEKRAAQDKINKDIEWPEHVGIYNSSGANALSDIGASLLYGGHVKKITKHNYDAEGQILESRSYWLEYRDVCPDFISKEKDFLLNTNFKQAAIFHADMGLCILSKPTEHIVEPIQLVSIFKWRRDETKTREFTILNSTIAPDLTPDPNVILAKLTKIGYKKTPRVRFTATALSTFFLHPPLGLYTKEDSGSFISSRLPAMPEHILMRTNGTSGFIRHDSTLRYISNIGMAGQGKYLTYENRSAIKNPYELIPTKSESMLIASKKLSKLSPKDFPLTERNSRLSSFFTHYRISKIRDDMGVASYQKVIENIIPAVSAELNFLHSGFDVTKLKIKKGHPYSTKPMVVSLDGMTVPRLETKLMQSAFSEDFKDTLFKLVLDIDSQKLNIKAEADEQLTLQTVEAIYNLASEVLLEDEDVRHDISNAILNKILSEKKPKSSRTRRYYNFDYLLAKKGHQFPEVVERLLTDIERGQLEDWQIARNFNVINNIPADSLISYKERLLFQLDKYEIKTRLRRKLRK